MCITTRTCHCCDASPVGVTCILSHVMPDGSERPVMYASRTLQQAERNYSQLEREALGIVFGIKYFHKYVAGRKFTVVTDHKPLLGIFRYSKTYTYNLFYQVTEVGLGFRRI